MKKHISINTKSRMVMIEYSNGNLEVKKFNDWQKDLEFEILKSEQVHWWKTVKNNYEI